MSQSAASPSTSPVGRRDERLHSIYDKYLYDAKDLSSPDPIIRELARKASLDRQKQTQYQDSRARRLQLEHTQAHLGSLDEDPAAEGGIGLHDMSAGRHQTTGGAAASAASAFAKTGSPSKQQRSGPKFADDAKREDGNGSRPGGGERQSGDAWAAVGGLMTGGLSDSDDSSDDERGAPRHRAQGRLEKQQQQQQSRKPPPSASASAAREDHEQHTKTVRASWTSRAAAVGSRPPDSASQNPITLKLLGLKSIKEGGAPIGASATSPSQPSYGAQRSPDVRAARFEGSSNGRVEPEAQSRQQILSVSDYGDRDHDRHGSTINFGGGSGDGFGGGAPPQFGPPRPVGNRGTQLSDPPTPSFGPADPLRPPNASSAQRPVSPRTNDLTKQLGLGSSSPAVGPARSHGDPSPQQQQVPPPQLRQSPPQQPRQLQQQPPRAPAPAYVPNERARIGSESSSGGSSPTRALLPHTMSSSSEASLRSPRDPFNDSAGAVPLHRGPGPLQQQQQQAAGSRGMAHPPNMMPGRSGHGPGGPPQPPRNQMGPPPQAPRPPPGYTPHGAGPPHPQQQRGGPPQPPMMARPQPPQPPQQPRGPPMQPGPRPQPGFSDSPGPSRGQADPQRRSLFRRSMAFVMGNGDNGQGLQAPGQGGNGAGAQGNRRSLLRRSMAFLSGRPMPPQPPQPQRGGAPPADDDANAPQPRVQGFVDEKPRDRKSTYLGAGGMGDEWDYGGAGARFWNRFNKAQEKSQKMDPASEAYRRKAVRGRRTAQAGATVGLIVIVGLVIGIVIWREGIKADPNAIPGAIDRNTGGSSSNGQTYLVDKATSSSSSTRRHRNTSTNGNAKRAEPTGAVDLVERAVASLSIETPSLEQRQASLFEGAMIKRRMRDHHRRIVEGATPVPRAYVAPVMDELD